MCVFNLSFFFETKNIDVEQKHNLKITKNKDKKRDFKEKTRQEKKKGLMKNNFVIEYFDVVLFMKQSKEQKQKKEEQRKRKRKKKRTRRKRKKI